MKICEDKIYYIHSLGIIKEEILSFPKLPLLNPVKIFEHSESSEILFLSSILRVFFASFNRSLPPKLDKKHGPKFVRPFLPI